MSKGKRSKPRLVWVCGRNEFLRDYLVEWYLEAYPKHVQHQFYLGDEHEFWSVAATPHDFRQALVFWDADELEDWDQLRGWVDGLREHNGLDLPVREWLEQDEAVDGMLNDILNFLRNWLPKFQISQRSYVTVGIGCTGGRHRSVYLVDRLASGLSRDFGHILIHHRELQA